MLNQLPFWGMKDENFHFVVLYLYWGDPNVHQTLSTNCTKNASKLIIWAKKSEAVFLKLKQKKPLK